ncbi:26S protease-like protein regulatory subunit 6B, partial [Aureobasidium melanogenum]
LAHSRKTSKHWTFLANKNKKTVKNIFICAVCRDIVHSGFILMEQSLLVEVKLVGLGRSLDLASVSVFKVLLNDVVAVLSNSSQTRFLHDGSDDSTTQGIVANNETSSLTSVAKVRELDLSVKTTRTEKGGIQSVGTVGGHDDLDVTGLIETIHLVEQLEQDTLNLSIGTGLSIETFGGNGVNLVDEDDARTVLASHTENVSDHARTLTQILLNELGSDDSDEGCGSAYREGRKGEHHEEDQYRSGGRDQNLDPVDDCTIPVLEEVSM